MVIKLADLRQKLEEAENPSTASSVASSDNPSTGTSTTSGSISQKDKAEQEDNSPRSEIKNALESIALKSAEMYDMIKDNGKLEAWAKDKLTISMNNLEEIYAYLKKASDPVKEEAKLEESTPPSKDYLKINTNKGPEIEWAKKKILSLRPKYEKKPSTYKEIKDLERQIKERGGTPDKHDWIKQHNEEVEPIEELSKTTLSSYLDKAASPESTSKYANDPVKRIRKAGNRLVGATKAANKIINKEETELEEGYKYLQYPSHKEAVAARQEHFKNNPGDPCRNMGNGKLAYMGTFGGPKPKKTVKEGVGFVNPPGSNFDTNPNQTGGDTDSIRHSTDTVRVPDRNKKRNKERTSPIATIKDTKAKSLTVEAAPGEEYVDGSNKPTSVNKDHNVGNYSHDREESPKNLGKKIKKLVVHEEEELEEGIIGDLRKISQGAAGPVKFSDGSIRVVSTPQAMKIMNMYDKQTERGGRVHIGKSISKSYLDMMKFSHSNGAPMQEETEELDELSNRTLASYVDKASDDLNNQAVKQDMDAILSTNNKSFLNRLKFKNKAQGKIKEDVEPIEELSKNIINSYIDKASGSPGRGFKRTIGIQRALNRKYNKKKFKDMKNDTK